MELLDIVKPSSMSCYRRAERAGEGVNYCSNRLRRPGVGPGSGEGRILYIEDETGLQWLVKHILESVGGFEVLVCGSGAEGLRSMEVLRLDQLLLDIMMPEMDGFSVLFGHAGAPVG